MSQNSLVPHTYLYTFNCAEEEQYLCKLEVRSMFRSNLHTFVLESSINIDPSRSPFIKEKIEVLFICDTLEDLLRGVREMPPLNGTYKVIGINYRDIDHLDKMGFQERKEIARQVACLIPGVANLDHPEIVFAITKVKGKWFFGYYSENQGIWLIHQQKPHNYSTALTTRVARALVNIAVPELTGVKVIDPCCGIGTVLVEALSMGVNIIGSDYNPLVMKGIRNNLTHFGLSGSIFLRDIRDITEMYDVAIIDMPYNLCSVVSDKEKFEMLQCARRFAKKMVVVTTEDIDGILNEVGFEIADRCEVVKGKFIRQIIICY
ncbi:TRM11 family SAM-dependent methyltransferase [Niallia endozanthoxylica]|uniref:RNA methyltransferase n=1 Tax=Niallia endozanthoxylica TaxID=2036016 RepID=A0A5J5H476_9BACI|nr:RsmD family RNA methyltransferase [Niallia endozanthoxylica]KAA9014573.1 RNA methyltransferase [Niallia endozanthoxylica]